MMRDLPKPVLVTAVIVLTTAGITGAGAPRPATAATRAKTAPRAAAAATVAPVVACGQLASETDGVWAKDDLALRVSFGYASEHALAQAAKAILAAYYGKPPAFSYYDGGSDGGHEALVEAQRYPHDFNGISSGWRAGGGWP
jgi:hypothetical protein